MIIFYMNCVSAHQLPLAREIVTQVGIENFRYIDAGIGGQPLQTVETKEPWILHINQKSNIIDKKIISLLENCELLLVGGHRPIDLLEKRCKRGLKTYYTSERWFKPFELNFNLLFNNLNFYLLIPGCIRMLFPRYFIMAKRFANLFKNECYRYLPIGPYATRDMEKIFHFFNPLQKNSFSSKIIPWGYFVENSNFLQNRTSISKTENTLNVLYIGRLLKLKRVDTIIRAVSLVNKSLEKEKEKHSTILLSIVGNGPEEANLRRLADKCQNSYKNNNNNFVQFHPQVPLTEVRKIMHDHDLVVFSSNALDGWGAVVSEALSEGIPVIGTYESGASATLLPSSQLFHAGDYKTLAKLLIESQNKTLSSKLPVLFTPEGASKRLLS